jgi:tRNA threonylcarbamoyladenosine biosynthesis protein TsaE
MVFPNAPFRQVPDYPFGVSQTTLVLPSNGPDDTARMAKAIAPELRAGDVVLLVGELGTGKSTFVRGVASSLGVTEYVTSPTFSVAQRYDSGAVPIAHLDAYRLVDPDDEDFELTLDVIGEDAVAFIEWPDALADRLPEARLTITLEHGGGDARLLAFATSDPHLLEPLRQLG